MRVTVEVHDQGVRRAFERMAAAGRKPEEYLDPIGAALVASSKARFIAGRGPDGSGWRPVLRGGQPLRDTGTHLMNPLHHVVTGDSVEVGVPHAWAAVHQFGKVIKAKNAAWLRFKIGNRWARKRSVTIPARPFLGVSGEDRGAILRILRDRLAPA